MTEVSDKNPHREVLPAALNDSTVSRIYANGFTIGLSNADAHIVLQFFGRPIAVVSLSFTVAKTLHQKLGDMVDKWEKATQQQLQTTDTIDRAFEKAKR